MVFGYIVRLFSTPDTKPVTSVLPNPLHDQTSDFTDPQLPMQAPEQKEMDRGPVPTETQTQGRDEAAASCICCYLCVGLLAGYT